jgi:hypothetical protein
LLRPEQLKCRIAYQILAKMVSARQFIAEMITDRQISPGQHRFLNKKAFIPRREHRNHVEIVMDRRASSVASTEFAN